MDTMIKATFLYWLLLFTLRVLGRRPGNQMTPFEFILIFLIGGMGVQSVVVDDRSVINAVLGIMTVALNHVAAARLKQRYIGFRKVIDGTPVVIVAEGEWHEDRMQQLSLQEQDVMAMARQQSIKNLEEIDYAVVERNGAIAVMKKEGR